MTTAPDPAAQPVGSAASSRVVLADYFLGFENRAVSGGMRPWRLYYESEEDAGRADPKCTTAFSGDLYLNGDIKDIASTYYPAIGPYDAADPHVGEYHVLLAKAAGIDGFMAEFTIGQESKLLNLVAAAKQYGFRVGVNWINQSHLKENSWRDRAEAMASAREVVRWMVKHVYDPCGVRINGKYVFMIFLAHPREPAEPFDAFFSPREVAELKAVAAAEGCDADFLVLPWEPLADAPSAAGTWDGYFPWVWSSSGAATSEDGHSCWSRQTTREQYVERLRSYYATSRRLAQAGRIGTYIGGVCPGFDDHKGQAWGESLRRHLPRDGGQTLRDTWGELKRSDVQAALIITWNDWVESSQVEPSLELGNADLLECARQIADWRGRSSTDERLVQLPEMLLRSRRDVELLRRAGMPDAQTRRLSDALDRCADAISIADANSATTLLTGASSQLQGLKGGLRARPVHAVWEYGFDSVGLRVETAGGRPNRRVTAGEFSGLSLGAGADRVGVRVNDEIRTLLRSGHVVGRFCFEYLDAGKGFLRVLVDAADERHQVIASFKKSGSGGWRTASIELVNARFSAGLPGGYDVMIEARPDEGGGVRLVRIDITSYRT